MGKVEKLDSLYFLQLHNLCGTNKWQNDNWFGGYLGKDSLFSLHMSVWLHTYQYITLYRPFLNGKSAMMSFLVEKDSGCWQWDRAYAIAIYLKILAMRLGIWNCHLLENIEDVAHCKILILIYLNFADRWHCTSGFIRTWNLLFLCTKIALNYVLFKPNSLRNVPKGTLTILVGGRNLACRDLDRHRLLYLFLW